VSELPTSHVRWLLTVAADADVAALADALVQLDAELTDEDPVPLDQCEQVLSAAGPRDLPDKVRQAGLPVHKVSPDSDFTPY
jgi:hypothetical protein